MSPEESSEDSPELYDEADEADEVASGAEHSAEPSAESAKLSAASSAEHSAEPSTEASTESSAESRSESEASPAPVAQHTAASEGGQVGNDLKVVDSDSDSDAASEIDIPTPATTDAAAAAASATEVSGERRTGKRRGGERREGKGRQCKGREGNGREGKGRGEGRTWPFETNNWVRTARSNLTFYSLAGEPILLSRWISTRIRIDTNLECYLRHVAEAIDWPMSHIALCPQGHPDVTVRMLPPDRPDDEEEVFPITLISRLFPNGGDVVVKVMKMSPPVDFCSYGGCACDFGSCCILCTAPDFGVCCGQDACCRSGDCGHRCCAEIVKGNGASVPYMRRVCQRLAE
jgi:hypothetical protein